MICIRAHEWRNLSTTAKCMCVSRQDETAQSASCCCRDKTVLLTKMYSEQHKTIVVKSALQDAPLTISLRTNTNTTKPRREKALTETAHKDDVFVPPGMKNFLSTTRTWRTEVERGDKSYKHPGSKRNSLDKHCIRENC